MNTIASSFKDISINKPPLPTDVFEEVNTPISCINTTDIDITFCTLGRWKFKYYICVKRRSGTLPIGSTFYIEQTHPLLWN